MGRQFPDPTRPPTQGGPYSGVRRLHSKLRIQYGCEKNPWPKSWGGEQRFIVMELHVGDVSLRRHGPSDWAGLCLEIKKNHGDILKKILYLLPI